VLGGFLAAGGAALLVYGLAELVAGRRAALWERSDES
jgi:4-amino-4-deoxy-L-arabinose transferase-like glycosyltransferase